MQAWRSVRFLLLLLSAGHCAGPDQKEEPVLLLRDPPAAPGAMAPHLTASPSGAYLTWLEPSGPRGESWAVRFARLTRGSRGRSWEPAGQIVEGAHFFANWADLPSLQEGPDGSLLAHWLAKTGAGTYAYGVRLARSFDGSSTWTPLGTLHEDGTETEHGFVSMVPEDPGLRLFWLDGREMAHGGPMTLRTALVDDAIGPALLLDKRVCECCQTAAAAAADGPVIVYRNRTAEEIRDIFIIRKTSTGWSEPAPVHADHWKVPGCPVNGPAIASGITDRRLLAVAWFTAADNEPQVKLAFSRDGGARFSEPLRVDDGRPLGRVQVVLDEQGDAFVAWMEAEENQRARIRLRRVASGTRPGASLGKALTLANTRSSRASGVPQLVQDGGDLVLAWTQPGETSRVRTGFLARADVPAASATASTLPAAGGPSPGPGTSPWDGSPGSPAPAYSAPTLDGRTIALADFRGGPLLLNVWATWCAPCREEMKVLASLHRRYGPAGLRVVGVSVDPKGAAHRVRRFIEEHETPYTILHDPEDRISSLLALRMLPGNFLFDADGFLLWSRPGAIHEGEAELAAAISGALKRRPD